MPGKVFHKADESVMGVVRDMIREHHPDVEGAGVRVGVIMVEPATNEDGEVVAPAVKFAGAEAVAVCRKVARKMRTLLPYEAIIEVDMNRWQELSDESRAALLDHEITHIEVVRGDDGQVAMDDDLRPKIRLRPDDFILTGFYSVIERHGADALEYQSVSRLIDEHGQRLFAFASAPTKKSSGRKLAEAAA